jgi:tetratricopeptide (TPR) repeat protein
MRLIGMILAGLMASSLVALTQVAWTQTADESRRLSACVEKIESDPSGAYEDGLQWMSFGSRPAARHCVALALIALEQPAEGAARLEQLANAPDAGGLEPRILYLSQAGNAWILAGAPEAALVTLGNAIRLSPKDAALRSDRARAHMLLKQWTEAGVDLDSAIQLSPGDASALAMRAQVLFQLDRLDDAWRDAEAARALDPKNIDTLVLRGRIRDAIQSRGLPDPVQ